MSSNTDEITKTIKKMQEQGKDNQKIYETLIQDYDLKDINKAFHLLQNSAPANSPKYTTKQDTKISKKTIKYILILAIIITLPYWFFTSGWFNILSDATEMSLSAIEIDDIIITPLKHGLNCIWILFTEPHNYNEKCLSHPPPATSLYGLEITSLRIAPKQASAGTPAKIFVSIENKGSIKAENSEVEIIPDDNFFKFGGLLDEKKQTIGAVSSLGDTNLFFPIEMPRCPDTYKITSKLEYEYRSDAIYNLDIMDKNVYHTRAEQDKLNQKVIKSTSSVGPVTLEIHTGNGNVQPISSGDEIHILFKLINNRNGIAHLKDASFEIPDILVPSSKEDYCDLIKNSGIYTLKKSVKDSYGRTIPSKSDADALIFTCIFNVDPNLASDISIVKTYFIKASVDYVYHIEKDAKFEIKGTGLEKYC